MKGTEKHRESEFLNSLRREARFLPLEVAVVLIALGIVAFAYQGITYTTRGNVFDFGPMHMTAERTNHIPLPPIFGAVALIGGLALLLVETKRSRAAG